MTTTIEQTKQATALKVLRKNNWISSQKIKDATGESDLRSVRRLREMGYEIVTRRNGGVYQYKRISD